MRFLLPAVLAAALTGVAADALAASCGPREAVARRLAAGYGEHPVAAGVTRGGALIELYTSAEGSFSVVLVRPDGLACLMAVGEGWQKTPPADRAPGRGT